MCILLRKCISCNLYSNLNKKILANINYCKNFNLAPSWWNKKKSFGFSKTTYFHYSFLPEIQNSLTFLISTNLHCTFVGNIAVSKHILNGNSGRIWEKFIKQKEMKSLNCVGNNNKCAEKGAEHEVTRFV